MQTFGDPGRIQGALDDNLCPCCLSFLPPLNENGEFKCKVCRLVIIDNNGLNEQRFGLLLTNFVGYYNKVRSKLCNHR